MNVLKIVEPGWEGYTGPLAQVEFVDGVSTAPVTQIMEDRIAGLIRVEIVGEGKQAGIGARIADGKEIAAKVVEPLVRQSDAAGAAEYKLQVLRENKPEFYTREQLEAVADEHGIKGLREIGNKIEAKGRAIPELIDDILTAQERIDKEIADAALELDRILERDRQEG